MRAKRSIPAWENTERGRVAGSQAERTRSCATHFAVAAYVGHANLSRGQGWEQGREGQPHHGGGQVDAATPERYQPWQGAAPAPPPTTLSLHMPLVPRLSRDVEPGTIATLLVTSEPGAK